MTCRSVRLPNQRDCITLRYEHPRRTSTAKTRWGKADSVGPSYREVHCIGRGDPAFSATPCDDAIRARVQVQALGRRAVDRIHGHNRPRIRALQRVHAHPAAVALRESATMLGIEHLDDECAVRRPPEVLRRQRCTEDAYH